ncbi:hypothetical protein B0H34DRAFT_680868 [Crassisporium funariophilum]|nr:hypothetical protein B0H34DRAFT_680868 [Crassisporium funariophilum]
MPPRFDSGDELSLRHLPDVSDNSFSFQIPGTVPNDYLLAEDDADFFRGADALASPPITTTRLLTLSQLTPRPMPETSAPQNSKKPRSFPTLSYDHTNHDTMPTKEIAAEATIPKLEPSKPSNKKGVSKPWPKTITPSALCLPAAEGSPSGARLDSIRAELDLLSDELHASPSTVSIVTVLERPKGIRRKSIERRQLQSREEKREKSNQRNKQKVIEGGITKTRGTSRLTKEVLNAGDEIPNRQTYSIPPSSQQPRPVPVADADVSAADTSISSLGQGGVAERLVMYSQKFISSFGLFNSDRSMDANDNQHPCEMQDLNIGTDAKFVRRETADDNERPLTLSQLSPRKCTSRAPTPTPTPPPDDVPKSPVRPSLKRPVFVASEIQHQHKRSKTSAPSAALTTAQQLAESVINKKPQLPATKKHPRPKPNLPGSSSNSRPFNGDIRKTKARVNGTAKQAPVFKPGKFGLNGYNEREPATLGAPSSASSSSCTTRSRNKISRQEHKDRIEPVKLSSSSTDKEKRAASASTSKISAKPVLHAPLVSTKPFEFNFHTDARIETHKSDKGKTIMKESQGEKEQPHARHHIVIPDFKALHAAQEAKLALRKENITPVVSLPIRWETDLRVKERQKFDERMREKEREQERLMEVKRSEREEQEERELRELRKKAIPKAHEVPEWYKEAPKKKDKAMDSIGR